jgi:hypothetical protein
MARLQIGERVRLIGYTEKWTDYDDIPLGSLGTITDNEVDLYDMLPPYNVQWDNGVLGGHFSNDIQPATEPAPSVDAGEAAISDDRMYWWDTLGRDGLTPDDLKPRNDLKPDTLERWPKMWDETYRTAYRGPSRTDNERYDMLDALDVIATLEAALTETRSRLAAAEAAHRQLLEWAYALMIELAVKCLDETNRTVEPGEWPNGQEWENLVGTSRSVFLHKARQLAGINHSEWRAVIEPQIDDRMVDIWDRKQQASETVRPSATGDV